MNRIKFMAILIIYFVLAAAFVELCKISVFRENLPFAEKHDISVICSYGEIPVREEDAKIVYAALDKSYISGKDCNSGSGPLGIRLGDYCFYLAGDFCNWLEVRRTDGAYYANYSWFDNDEESMDIVLDIMRKYISEYEEQYV